MATPTKGFRGTKKEQERFWECETHRRLAQDDLENRIPDFDKKDELFRNWLDEGTWPYRALVTDPRIWTMIIDKTSRLIAGKPRGELTPREGGDVLKAKIQNELLNFQWDEVARIEGEPMISKWTMLDMNARKYGAGFGVATWHWHKSGGKVQFDGPSFRVIPNRDCLPNPSYSTVRKWFQYRDYLTLDELKSTNNAASGPPIYKNLNLLEQAISDEKRGKGGGAGGDLRSSNWASRNKAITGVEDALGRDVTRKVVEVITEMRPDRWITFAPKHGIILRDIPNPYKHGQIPVVLLKYYIIDDDIYGLSEIEPVERLAKSINALICQYLDSVNTDLYPPLKVRSTGVRMNTIDFGPNKRWIMNDPATDVIRMDTSTSGAVKFTQTYSFMVAAMMNAIGASSLGISNVGGMQQRKTAQEVRSLMGSQNARDNFNQIFLAEALKRQMMLWHLMNKQFIFADPSKKYLPLRISGKKALKFFQEQGMDILHPTEEEAMMAAENPEMADNIPIGPESPVMIDGELKPKLEMDVTGKGGILNIVPEDFVGNYDYKADIVSMALPDNYAERMALQDAIKAVTENQNALAMEGYKPKMKELLVRYLETTQYFRDADQYFEPLQGGLNGQGQEIPGQTPLSGGTPAGGAGGTAPGAMPSKGVGGRPTPIPGSVPNQIVGQPQGV